MYTIYIQSQKSDVDDDDSDLDLLRRYDYVLSVVQSDDDSGKLRRGMECVSIMLNKYLVYPNKTKRENPKMS